MPNKTKIILILIFSFFVISFKVFAQPQITNFTSPVNVGDQVTISGSGFGATQDGGSVKFVVPDVVDSSGWISAGVVSWSDTQITVTVPMYAMTGPIKVINNASQETTSSDQITIKPTVSSASASTTSVKIIFDNFMNGSLATNPSNYTLTVGGSSIDLSNAWADFRGNEVILRNISLTAGQSFQITVSSNVQSVSGTAIDTDHNTGSGTVIQAPQITSISPSSGSVGDTITITGTNFGTLGAGESLGDANHKVYFSPGEPTGPTPPEPVEANYGGCTGGCTWTDTQIKVRVPSGAKSGPIFVLRNGIESEFGPNSFFDVKGTFQCKILDSNGDSIGSTNGRIVIGTISGPALYYVGDSHSTSYDAATGIFTIPNVSTMGWVWAFDASGNHVTGTGTNIDITQTVTFSLEAATRKISGTITGARADTDIVVWTDPIAEPGTAVEWREPIFVHTNSNGQASFNIGVAVAGKYIVGVEDPGFKTSTQSNPKIAPTPQEADTTSGDVSGLEFGFAAAAARIHGQIQKAEGKTFAQGPGTDVFHVFAYEPKENGFHASAIPDSNGEFDLYVNPIEIGDPGVHTYIVEVGGPGIPFSAQQTIEVSNDDPNFALTDSTTDITLVIKAPEDYIEGTVTDSQGNGISGASIFAWSETGPGGGEAFTDSSGYYKLYLPPGTYSVEGFAPQYGKLSRKTGIVVSSTQHPTVNLSVSSEMATISGTVTKGGSPLTKAEIWVTEGEFGPGVNRTKTDSSGAYSLSVPYATSGTYWIHVAKPKIGELYRAQINTDLNSSNTSLTKNISINTATITVKISPKSAFSEAFVGIHGTGTTKGGGFSDTDTSLATDTFRQYVIEVPKPTTGNYTYRVEGGVLNYGPLPQNMTVDGNLQTDHNITVTPTTSTMTIEFDLGTLYTISGQIPDPNTNTSGNEAAGAFVWAASSTGFGGGEVSSDGSFSFKIPSGTYDIGIDKPGYIGSIIPNVQITSNYTVTSGDLTLTKSDTSISGTVTDSAGTALSEAWVWATNGTGGWAGTQTNGDGEFTLSVGSGDWTVRAIAEGYSESSPYTVSAGTSGLTISLSAVSGYSVTAPKVEPITPKDGGVVQGTNVKVEAPAGALGTDTSTGWLIIEDTTSLPTTNSFKPLGNKGKKIEAQDSTKTKITSLNSSVTIEITYTADDLSDAGLTQDEALDLSLGYWNSLTETWVALPTTAVPDSAGTGVTYKATTNHLSDFAPLVPSGANPPDTPTGLTATAGDGQITLSWNASSGATTYYIYRKSDSTYPYYAQTTATSYLDTGLTNGITYYYKVSALNADGDESAASSAVSATPQAVGGGAVPISYLQPQPEEVVEEAVEEEAPEEIEEEIPEEIEGIEIPTLEKPVSEMTIEELEAKIAEFLTVINQLKALLAEIKGEVKIEGIPAGFKFERNLRAGEVSEEVKYLQIVLNSDPDTQLANVGPGSPGEETTYFGPLTKRAVIKFQEKYAPDILAPWGLEKGTGFVGKTTRAKLNELLGM